MSLRAKHLAIIIATALVVRIMLGWAILHHNSYDIEKSIIGHDDYDVTAYNILHGNGFSSHPEPPYLPNLISVPIYPYFLALILWIFKSNLAIAIIQGALSVLIPVLAYLLVQRVIPSPSIALTTAIFLAIEPYTALLSITMLTETVFTIFWLAFICFFYDFLRNKTYKNIIFSALFFGLATLTRPNIQFIFILVPLFIWWRFKPEWSKDLYYKLALWCIVTVMVISPWLYRNYQITHKVIISAHVSDSLFLYLIPSILSLEKNITFEQARHELYLQEQITDVNDILKSDNSQKYTERGIQLIFEHPSGLAKTVLKTMVAFFTHDGYFDLVDRFSYKPILPSSLIDLRTTNGSGVIILLGRALWIGITISFGLGAFIFLKRHPKNKAALWSLGTTFYFMGITLIIGLGVNARFRFAVNTFIIMFSVYAWQALFKTIQGRQKKP